MTPRELKKHVRIGDTLLVDGEQVYVRDRKSLNFKKLGGASILVGGVPVKIWLHRRRYCLSECGSYEISSKDFLSRTPNFSVNFLSDGEVLLDKYLVHSNTIVQDKYNNLIKVPRSLIAELKQGIDVIKYYDVSNRRKIFRNTILWSDGSFQGKDFYGTAKGYKTADDITLAQALYELFVGEVPLNKRVGKINKKVEHKASNLRILGEGVFPAYGGWTSYKSHKGVVKHKIKEEAERRMYDLRTGFN